MAADDTTNEQVPWVTVTATDNKGVETTYRAIKVEKMTEAGAADGEQSQQQPGIHVTMPAGSFASSMYYPFYDSIGEGDQPPKIVVKDAGGAVLQEYSLLAGS